MSTSSEQKPPDSDVPGFSSAEEDPEKDFGPGIAIGVTALILVLPIYFLCLMLYYGTFEENSLGSLQKKLIGGKGRSTGKILVNGIPNDLTLDGESPPEIATTTERILKNLLATISPRSSPSSAPASAPFSTSISYSGLGRSSSLSKAPGLLKSMLYLRCKTLETFSENGVKAVGGNASDSQGANFAFPNGEVRSGEGRQIWRLRFLQNFDPILMHPPLMARLAGPMPFKLCHDGAIRFPATIAAGDVFECEVEEQPLFSPGMTIAQLPLDSPFLAVGQHNSKELRQLAHQIAFAGGTGMDNDNHDASGMTTNRNAFPEAIGMEKNEAGGETNTEGKNARENLLRTVSPSAVRSQGVSSASVVMRIGDFFEHAFLYDLNPPKPLAGQSVFESFLLKSRRGHCRYFAAGIVLLCRLNGIGARVATGFLAFRGVEDNFLVPGSSGHAWVEILTTHGWARFDVAVAAAEQRVRANSMVPLPSEEEIKGHLATVLAENRRKGSGLYRTEGEAADSSHEELESRVGEGPPRIVNEEWEKSPENTLEPESEGSISGDSEMKRCAEERKKQSSQRVWENQKRRILIIIGLFLIAGILYKLQAIEKIVQRLLKLIIRLWNRLFGRVRPTIESAESGPQLHENLLKSLDSIVLPTLEGRDVVRLFNRFSKCMGEVAGFSREKEETSREYLDRLKRELACEAIDAAFLAGTFSECLYGKRKPSPLVAGQFRDMLRNILKSPEVVSRIQK
ncbi:MAG: transglutaminase domain-containing protein [Candidatus Riflebacteria bacterium]|nr:transglutaminase domain-containing protein [Candidatus Riflebacteria bacterium]